MNRFIEYAILIGGACTIAYIWEELKPRLFKDRVQIDYDKMKRQLLKLLDKDGYRHEMEEGHIIIIYRNERFFVFLEESQFGKQFARVTIADYYTVKGMEEVHPFVMDAVMARATNNCPRIINLSFEDHCLGLYSTDMKNIEEFFRGLRPVLDLLIENEKGVRQDFVQFHSDFGRQKDVSEDKHIGFRTSSEEHEEEHSVAAKASMSVE